MSFTKDASLNFEKNHNYSWVDLGRHETARIPIYMSYIDIHTCQLSIAGLSFATIHRPSLGVTNILYITYLNSIGAPSLCVGKNWGSAYVSPRAVLVHFPRLQRTPACIWHSDR